MTSLIWEPIGAMALSIFITIALFFFVYLAAYIICRGFIFTWKMIKKAWAASKEDNSKQ